MIFSTPKQVITDYHKILKQSILMQEDQTTATNLHNQQQQQQAVIELNIDPNRPKYGNMIVLLDSNYLKLTLGPDYTCFFIAFLFFCALSFLLSKTVNQALQNELIIWLTYLLSFLQCLSYLLVALSNPGIALRQNNPIKVVTKENKFRICSICGAENKRRTYHCQYCDICIEEYDHHCPWTSKCIGKRNLWKFNLFVTLTPIYMISFIGLMIICLTINDQQMKKNHIRSGTL